MQSRRVIACLLAVVTLAVFWRTGGNEFINFDDPAYIIGNPHVATGLSLANVGWALSATYLDNWHPLTWLSHMLDCQLYGLNPHGQHLTSVFIHAGSAVLLFLFLSGVTAALWPSAFVALVFAVHPLHVESVAWLSERKDVLSAFFFMLTLCAYARYVKAPAATRYLLVVVSFALGLMSKSMLVTLPFVLLLLDYWPLQRFSASSAGKLVVEKLPLLLLSAAVSGVTFWAQKSGGSVKSVEKVPLVLRVENATVSYCSYLRKTFWPSDLVVFYPLPTAIAGWQVAAAALLILAVCIAAIMLARRAPFLVVGWFWFLGMLVPVIGLVQVGNQAMADRYSYLPLIGIAIAVAWGIRALAAGGQSGDRAVMVATAVVAPLLFVCSWLQVGHWKNSEELFSWTVQHTRENAVAHASLGMALAERGDFGDAAYHFGEAVRIRPDDPDAQVGLGRALHEQGRLDEAIVHYREAARLNPRDDKVYLNLGLALAAQKRIDESIDCLNRALTIRPDFADAHLALGMELQERHDVAGAVGHYAAAVDILQQGLALQPERADLQYNLNLAKAKLAEVKR